MPRADFARIQTSKTEGGSDVLDQHIQHVDDAFRKLGDVVNNEKIQTVTFKKGVPQTIGHGLGQPVKFFDVSMRTAPAHVYIAGQTTDPARSIVLAADADVTVTLRFT